MGKSREVRLRKELAYSNTLAGRESKKIKALVTKHAGEVRRVARERASEEHSIRELDTQAATLSRKLHNTKAKLEEELKRGAAERVKNIQRLGAAKAALAHTLKALQQEKKDEAEGKDQNEKLLQNL